MKKIFGVLIVALVLSLSACTTFKATGLAYGNFSGSTVGTFEKTIKVWKFVGSSAGSTIANLSQDKVDDAVNEAIRAELQRLGADAAIDVSIEESASFVDMIINDFTSCILAPTTIKITGTAVKF